MISPKPLRRLALVLGLALASLSVAGAVAARAAGSTGEHEIERLEWSFSGFTGLYDRAQLQRGFQVYQQVCAACHGLERVRFRNLAEPGGPEFPVEAVKELAKNWPYAIHGDLDDEGNEVERVPGLPDPIVGPFKNDKQARAAQNGALPPDLSLITKARTIESHAPWYTHWLWMLSDIVTGYQEAGADYTYALLTGYRDEPPAYKRDAKGLRLIKLAEDEIGSESFLRCATVDPGAKAESEDEEDKPDTCNELQEGMYYNIAFPGHQIAMPPPLSTDMVIEYQPDAGAKSTFEQNSKDVTAFLAWAADPSLDARKELGWFVMLYLLITTVLLYLVKRLIWSRIKH